jgi:hypothetical protein
MQITLVLTVVLHVLSGVFWAGSTFTLTRTGNGLAQRLFRPQMGAAVVAVATGGLLWFLFHRGPAGTTEYVLALGAVCALLAAGVQGALGAQALREAGGATESTRAQAHLTIAQRAAAALLAVTVACMAAARYV